ncbi:MAG: response regulator [Proteobacteria bacterium]|nr:response regulator [Pseudomonadota bacterium]
MKNYTKAELLKKLEEAKKETDYYKNIAEISGNTRLRETEELSILIARQRKIESELEKVREELEKRVQERTVELLRANELLKQEISDRKKAEQERIRLDKLLRQAQKMEAIGTLAGGIAHDFNNILGIIYGNVEISLRKTPSDSEIKLHLNRVVDALKRATELVGQILTFSQQHYDKQRPIDLKITINETLNLLRSSIPSTIDIRQHIAKETGIVFADSTQIHQVVLNLCVNSCHAMIDKGGLIEITLDNRYIDKDHAAGKGIEAGKYVRLAVRDTGHGINAQDQPRIFEPYFTTKADGTGTGLGLSVVHGIVKKHKGCISVSSELNKGTEFVVLLPVINDASQVVEETSKTVSLGKERILLVDDEVVLLETIHQLIGNLGYTVTVKMSSEEALRAFKEKPSEFDLVITDQTMPGLTGTQLAAEIRKTRLDIPIILCTGFSTNINKDNYREYEINELILKPVNESDIARTIRKVLDESIYKKD